MTTLICEVKELVVMKVYCIFIISIFFHLDDLIKIVTSSFSKKKKKEKKIVTSISRLDSQS